MLIKEYSIVENVCKYKMDMLEPYERVLRMQSKHLTDMDRIGIKRHIPLIYLVDTKDKVHKS